VEAFPGSIEGSRGALGEWVRPCAWDRRPKPRSPVCADVAGTRGETPASEWHLQRSANRGPDVSGGEKGSARRSPKPVPGGCPWSSGWAFGPLAPAYVGPAATSRSRFRRSSRGALADAAPFFYPRPLLAQPPANLPLVALAGLPRRLLRGDVPLRQPLVEIAGMELLAKRPRDQLGHARRGSQLSGEAKLRWRAAKPLQDFPLFLGGKLGLASRGWPGLQPPHILLAVGVHPTLHAAQIDIHKIGDFLLRIARVNPVDGQTPPFQLGWSSFGSHTILYACP